MNGMLDEMWNSLPWNIRCAHFFPIVMQIPWKWNLPQNSTNIA